MTNAFDNLSWNDDFSGAVRLPFAALTLRTLRGESKMKGTQPDARYFGGWAYNDEDSRKMLADGDLLADPSWDLYEATGEKGDYAEHANRVAHVAVIKGRMRWSNDQARQYSTKYFQGARMHIQYLAGLFKRDKGTVSFCGMAMLTAKGIQASNLQKAIDLYANFIRTATAGEPELMKLPRPAWIITLGTYGDKPVFETVGKGSATSTLTPIKAVLPKDAAELTKRRVPADVLDLMGQRYEQAAQWLGAWKQAAAETEPIAVTQNADSYEEQPF